MRVNRRIARPFVLALLLLAFIGPWGRVSSSAGTSYLMHFPELVEHAMREPFHSVSILVGAILAVPIACLSAILAPSSRRAVIAYRVIGAGTAVPFLVALVSFRPRPDDLIEEWGVPLYLVALLLALVVEVVRARRAPQRDYADVFR